MVELFQDSDREIEEENLYRDGYEFTFLHSLTSFFFAKDRKEGICHRGSTDEKTIQSFVVDEASATGSTVEGENASQRDRRNARRAFEHHLS